MNKDTKIKIIQFLKQQIVLIFYILQVLLVLIYAETEVQPFVYIRF
jgi:hypothetical protein